MPYYGLLDQLFKQFDLWQMVIFTSQCSPQKTIAKSDLKGAIQKKVSSFSKVTVSSSGAAKIKKIKKSFVSLGPGNKLYQHPTQIPSTSHLLLIKGSRRQKKTTKHCYLTGIRGEKWPSQLMYLSSPVFLMSSSACSGRGQASGEDISVVMRTDLSRWWMINRTLHAGGEFKWYCWPSWAAFLTSVTNENSCTSFRPFH